MSVTVVSRYVLLISVSNECDCSVTDMSCLSVCVMSVTVVSRYVLLISVSNECDCSVEICPAYQCE